MATVDDKIRVGGSGLTVFSWGASGGSTLALLQTIQDTAPTPVAQAVPVQAITDAVPREIVTARAVGAGTLRLTFYETLNHPIWYQIQKEFQNATNLLEVLKAQLTLNAITCRKIIYNYEGTNPQKMRTKAYQKCKIVDIDDGETINIGTMVLPKGLTIMYTQAKTT